MTTPVLIDENLSRFLADGLEQLQYPLGNSVKIVSMEAKYGRGAKDVEWIENLGKEKGVFITKDIRITTRRHELEALKRSGLGAFFLVVPKHYRYWQTVKLIVQRWEEIVAIIDGDKRPFAYEITPRSFKRCTAF